MLNSVLSKLDDSPIKKVIVDTLNAHIRDGLLSGLNSERKGIVSFLQIGGNDGQMADPLVAWHSKNRWSGAIVEPVMLYFRRLEELHKENTRIRLLNCAVSDKEGVLDIHYLNSNCAGKYPTWTSGLASTDIQHLVRHGVAAEDCSVTSVPCVTPQQVVELAGLQRIDLLCVDVEGHEFPILTNFPFDTFDVTLTIFEAWHMPSAQRNSLNDWCKSFDRAVYFFGEDAFIVKHDDTVRLEILRELERFVADL